MGAVKNFNTVGDWRLWLEYRIPTRSLLRNLSITGEIGTKLDSNITSDLTPAFPSRLERNLSIQYTIDFSTAGKAKKK